jgi:hypothetical protein
MPEIGFPLVPAAWLAGFAGISLNELVLLFAKPCLYYIASVITISRRPVSSRYHSPFTSPKNQV